MQNIWGQCHTWLWGMRNFPSTVTSCSRSHGGHAQKDNRFLSTLSFARRIVENAFGILAAHWRIYHIKIWVQPHLVSHTVKAPCILHNYLPHDSTLPLVRCLAGLGPETPQAMVPMPHPLTPQPPRR